MLDEKTRRQAAQIADMVRSTTRRRIGTAFTVDGEVAVYRTGVLDDSAPLPVVAYQREELLLALHDGMGALYTAVMLIKEKKTRSVPCTRGELRKSGVSRATLTRLEKLGLIKQRIIKLNKVGGKNQPALVACYFTDEGRGYVRRFFDEHYGLPAEDACLSDLGCGSDAV